ncbi:hypothetical protein [Salinifilum ghardaiensis]
MPRRSMRRRGTAQLVDGVRASLMPGTAPDERNDPPPLPAPPEPP